MGTGLVWLGLWIFCAAHGLDGCVLREHTHEGDSLVQESTEMGIMESTEYKTQEWQEYSTALGCWSYRQERH